MDARGRPNTPIFRTFQRQRAACGCAASGPIWSDFSDFSDVRKVEQASSPFPSASCRRALPPGARSAIFTALPAFHFGRIWSEFAAQPRPRRAKPRRRGAVHFPQPESDKFCIPHSKKLWYIGALLPGQYVPVAPRRCRFTRHGRAIVRIGPIGPYRSYSREQFTPRSTSRHVALAAQKAGWNQVTIVSHPQNVSPHRKTTKPYSGYSGYIGLQLCKSAKFRPKNRSRAKAAGRTAGTAVPARGFSRVSSAHAARTNRAKSLGIAFHHGW